MKKITLAGALCLLIASSTFAFGRTLTDYDGPWCAPDVVTLTFRDQQARVELRTLKQVCDRNPENFQGQGLERSMRVEFRGRWVDVPKECTTGVSFGVDGLSLSGSKSGVSIRIVGKDNVETMIFASRKVSCSRVELCPDPEKHDNMIRKCSRPLAP